MSTAFVPLTAANELPQREIQIRNAIIDILRHEPKLAKDYQVKDVHYSKTSHRPWSMPYLYVQFRRRTENVDNTDIANFEYAYLFEIGAVANLKSLKEVQEEDYLLNLMTLVESSLSVNKALLGNTVLFHYAHELERDDSGFTNSVKHIVLRVEYTQDVPLGS